MKRMLAAMLLVALALPAFADAGADDRRHRLQQGADSGEPAAMFLLAHMLADGEGGPADAAAAHAWLTRAADASPARSSWHYWATPIRYEL